MQGGFWHFYQKKAAHTFTPTYIDHYFALIMMLSGKKWGNFIFFAGVISLFTYKTKRLVKVIFLVSVGNKEKRKNPSIRVQYVFHYSSFVYDFDNQLLRLKYTI